MRHIFFVEKNVRGAWVIYGDLGVRQYYYMTKREAVNRYNKECTEVLFFNEFRRVKSTKKETSTITG